jgi:predicted metal-dependent peptidase
MVARKRVAQKFDPATEAFRAGKALLDEHPLFRVLVRDVVRDQRSQCPPKGICMATDHGEIHANTDARFAPEVWAWGIAHAALHLGFGHLRKPAVDDAERTAQCIVVCRFLAALKVGTPWFALPELPGGEEESIASLIRSRGCPITLEHISTTAGRDVLCETGLEKPKVWEDRFASALEQAVAASLDLAAGEISDLGERRKPRSAWQAALSWFVGNYPLLGALAASFTIEEDPGVCESAGIGIAAISPGTQTLYLRGDVIMSADERRFIVAHELLHAGLRHDTRSGGRDAWLWNIACDYVINDWLLQMGVGVLPEGVLHDEELRGLSAEAVYDRIVVDLRRHRKARTFAGIGVPDMVPGRLADASCGVSLDEFYRRALMQGYELWRGVGRGLVPAGLVEEIRALAHPPVPWDVELARWFEHHIPALQQVRSYARLSRRQSSSPDIPRPSYTRPFEPDHKRTFGVVLDSSGSMDVRLLGRALGAIASFAQARDVKYVRVVFCDAAAYDAGWLTPEDIATRVRVRGRGGTVLQPGIDLLERAEDFPDDGPILIITDGACDRFRVRREHALLVPSDARLPFVPRGPVFRMPSVGVDQAPDRSNTKR